MSAPAAAPLAPGAGLRPLWGLDEGIRFLNHGASLVVEIGNNRAAAETAFPRLPMVWLPTETTEDSVFVVKREDLVMGR